MNNGAVLDYSLSMLSDRAAVARAYYRDYLANLEELYENRRGVRRLDGVPAVAFCGMGRSGKDTSAEYVCAKMGIMYPGSASRLALPLVAHMAGTTSTNLVWNQRHDHRVFWINACNALRENDLTLLARMCLGAGDVLVGPRAKPEFDAYVAQGIVDWTVWIDNPRVPSDITVEFTAGDCDLMVPNHGTKEELFAKWDKLMPVLYGQNSRRVHGQAD